MATDPPPTPLELEQARLQRYLNAEAAALEAQRYQVGDGSEARSLDRARLEEIRAGIAECRQNIVTLEQQAGAGAGRRVAFLRSGWGCR